MNELHYHRTEANKMLGDYIKGNLDEKQLQKFHYHTQRAMEAQREIDNKIPSKPHSKFYDLMNK